MEELRFLLSLSRECTIIVPMTLMVCTLQRQMLQIRRTFARTNLTFDPRHPLQREYYLGSAFSTDELFDGEKYHDNARCSIGYIRMQTVSLATKIYEARQRGEEENEDLKRRWMDLKDRLSAMEVVGALTRHLYMAVVWDCCAAEDVPTLTWSDANTHTSASNYKDFLRVLLCHDRCKFAPGLVLCIATGSRSLALLMSAHDLKKKLRFFIVLFFKNRSLIRVCANRTDERGDCIFTKANVVS